MAWKKLIYSGSDAELNSLSLDTALTVPNGGTGLTGVSSSYFLRGDGTNPLEQVAPSGTGNVVLSNGATLTNMIGTGSFSGSFIGDGSGLTGIDSGSAVFNINGVEFDADVHTSGITFKTGSADTGFTFSSSFSGTDFFLHVQAPQDLATDADVDFNTVTTTGKITLGSATVNGSEDTILVLDTSGDIHQREFSDIKSDFNLIDGTGASTRVPVFSDGDTLTTDVNFTFDTGTDVLTIDSTTIGTNVDVAGTLDVTSTLTLDSVSSDTDEDSILVIDGTGAVKQREWSDFLSDDNIVDGTGVADRVAFWSDTDTLTSDAEFEFNSSTNTLTVSGSTFSKDVYIAGNLQIDGEYLNGNVQNLLIEDRFALLNSGSAAGDGGIIVQTEANFSGSAFGWDDSEGRWGVQVNNKVGHAAVGLTPDGYMSVVIEGSGASAFEQKTGNIRVDSGEIYVWA